MKKPKIEAEEQQPRKVIRADKAPTSGYSLVVDGHFKSHHDTVEAAAAEVLENRATDTVRIFRCADDGDGFGSKNGIKRMAARVKNVVGAFGAFGVCGHGISLFLSFRFYGQSIHCNSNEPSLNLERSFLT